MGIPLLNKLIREKCKNLSNAIRQIHFSDLKGKIIAVDTSIYMYKFIGENALIDNMYQLIMFFKQNEIIPLFIFDGIAPPEKHELLQIRKYEKDTAENKYKELQQKLITINEPINDNDPINENDTTNEPTNEPINETKKEIINEMDILKKKFIRLKNSDIEEVKNLMKLCGVLYYDAEGEADQLCAKLVISNIAYACLSDDMDMFVYGCPLILRYMSLLHLTFILYDLSEILKYLNVSLHDFKQICIYSGTDYSNLSYKNSQIDLYKTFNYYEAYINTQNTLIVSNADTTTTKENNEFTFYNWLKNNIETDINNELKYLKLIKIYNMFSVVNLNISHYNIPDDIYSRLKKKYICKGPIREFLKRYNFIFTV